MTFEKLKNIMSEQLDLDPETITEQTEFSALGIDSLDIVEMLMSVEEEFGVSVEADQSLKTVADLVAAIDAAKE